VSFVSDETLTRTFRECLLSIYTGPMGKLICLFFIQLLGQLFFETQASKAFLRIQLGSVRVISTSVRNNGQANSLEGQCSSLKDPGSFKVSWLLNCLHC
jgi:hypothetical protein